MAKDQTLRSYKIKIDADIKSAEQNIAALQNLVKNKSGATGFGDAISSSIQEAIKSIGELKVASEKNFKSIQGSIDKISTKDLNKELNKSFESLRQQAEVIKTQTELLSELGTSLKSNDFSSFVAQMTKPFAELTESIKHVTDELKLLNGIKIGTVDVSGIKNTSDNINGLTQNIEKSIEALKKIQEDSTAILGNKKDLAGLGDEDVQALALAIDNVLSSVKHLKDENINQLFANKELKVSIDSLRAYRKEIDKLNPSAAVNQNRPAQYKQGKPMDAEVTVHYKVSDDAGTSADVEKIVGQIQEKVINKVNQKLENTESHQIKVPVKADIENLKKTITTQVDQLNSDIKSHTANIPDIEVNVRGVINDKNFDKEVEAISDEINEKISPKTDGNKLTIANDSGIATEGTLSSIRDILEGWDKNGLVAGTKTGSSKNAQDVYAKIDEGRSQHELSALPTLLHGKTISEFARQLNAANQSTLATVKVQQDYKQALMETSKIKKLEDLEKSRLFTSGIKGKDGITYSQYGRKGDYLLPLNEWQDLLRKSFSEGNFKKDPKKLKNQLNETEEFLKIINEFEERISKETKSTDRKSFLENSELFNAINKTDKGNRAKYSNVDMPIEAWQNLLSQKLKDGSLEGFIKDFKSQLEQQKIDLSGAFNYKTALKDIEKKLKGTVSRATSNGLEFAYDKSSKMYKLLDAKGSVTGSGTIEDLYLRRVKQVQLPYAEQKATLENTLNQLTELRELLRKVRDNPEEAKVESTVQRIRELAQTVKGETETERKANSDLIKSLATEYSNLEQQAKLGGLDEKSFQRFQAIPGEIQALYKPIDDIVAFANEQLKIIDGSNISKLDDEIVKVSESIKNVFKTYVSAISKMNQGIGQINSVTFEAMDNIPIVEYITDKKRYKKDLNDLKLKSERRNQLGRLVSQDESGKQVFRGTDAEKAEYFQLTKEVKAIAARVRLHEEASLNQKKINQADKELLDYTLKLSDNPLENKPKINLGVSGENYDTYSEFMGKVVTEGQKNIGLIISQLSDEELKAVSEATNKLVSEVNKKSNLSTDEINKIVDQEIQNDIKQLENDLQIAKDQLRDKIKKERSVKSINNSISEINKLQNGIQQLKDAQNGIFKDSLNIEELVSKSEETKKEYDSFVASITKNKPEYANIFEDYKNILAKGIEISNIRSFVTSNNIDATKHVATMPSKIREKVVSTIGENFNRITEAEEAFINAEESYTQKIIKIFGENNLEKIYTLLNSLTELESQLNQVDNNKLNEKPINVLVKLSEDVKKEYDSFVSSITKNNPKYKQIFDDYRNLLINGNKISNIKDLLNSKNIRTSRNIDSMPKDIKNTILESIGNDYESIEKAEEDFIKANKKYTNKIIKIFGKESYDKVHSLWESLDKIESQMNDVKNNIKENSVEELLNLSRRTKKEYNTLITSLLKEQPQYEGIFKSYREIVANGNKISDIKAFAKSQNISLTRDIDSMPKSIKNTITDALGSDYKNIAEAENAFIKANETYTNKIVELFGKDSYERIYSLLNSLTQVESQLNKAYGAKGNKKGVFVDGKYVGESTLGNYTKEQYQARRDLYASRHTSSTVEQSTLLDNQKLLNEEIAKRQKKQEEVNNDVSIELKTNEELLAIVKERLKLVNGQIKENTNIFGNLDNNKALLNESKSKSLYGLLDLLNRIKETQDKITVTQHSIDNPYTTDDIKYLQKGSRTKFDVRQNKAITEHFNETDAEFTKRLEAEVEAYRKFNSKQLKKHQETLDRLNNELFNYDKQSEIEQKKAIIKTYSKEDVLRSYDSLIDFERKYATETNKSAKKDLQNKINQAQQMFLDAVFSYYDSTKDFDVNKNIFNKVQSIFKSENKDLYSAVSGGNKAKEDLITQKAIKKELAEQSKELKNQIDAEKLRYEEQQNFQKSLKGNKKNISSDIDSQIIKLQNLINNKPLESNTKDLNIWINAIRKAQTELFNMQQEAEKLGLTVSSITGRAYGGKTNKDNQFIPGIKDLNSLFSSVGQLTNIQNKYNEDTSLPSYQRKLQMEERENIQADLNNQLRAKALKITNEEIDAQIKEGNYFNQYSKEVKALYNGHYFAGMTQEQAEIAKQLQKFNILTKNGTKGTQKQIEEFKRLTMLAQKLGLQINKKGYAMSGVSKDQWLANPFGYNTNSFTHSALFGDTKADGLATESTLQKILEVISSGKGYSKKSKDYSSTKGIPRSEFSKLIADLNGGDVKAFKDALAIFKSNGFNVFQNKKYHNVEGKKEYFVSKKDNYKSDDIIKVTENAVKSLGETEKKVADEVEKAEKKKQSAKKSTKEVTESSATAQQNELQRAKEQLAAKTEEINKITEKVSSGDITDEDAEALLNTINNLNKEINELSSRISTLEGKETETATTTVAAEEQKQKAKKGTKKVTEESKKAVEEESKAVQESADKVNQAETKKAESKKKSQKASKESVNANKEESKAAQESATEVEKAEKKKTSSKNKTKKATEESSKANKDETQAIQQTTSVIDQQSIELAKLVKEYYELQNLLFKGVFTGEDANDLNNKRFSELDKLLEKQYGLVPDSVKYKLFDSNLKEYDSNWVNSVFNNALSKYPKELIQNFVNGAKATTPEMQKAFEEIAKIPIDVVKQYLQISSPSKIMEELGYWTGEGFSKGVKETKEDIRKAILDSFINNGITSDQVSEWYSNLINPTGLTTKVGKVFAELLPDLNQLLASTLSSTVNKTDANKMFEAEGLKFTSTLLNQLKDEGKAKKVGNAWQIERQAILDLIEAQKQLVSQNETVIASENQKSEKIPGRIKKYLEEGVVNYDALNKKQLQGRINSLSAITATNQDASYQSVISAKLQEAQAKMVELKAREAEQQRIINEQLQEERGLVDDNEKKFEKLRQIAHEAGYEIGEIVDASLKSTRGKNTWFVQTVDKQYEFIRAVNKETGQLDTTITELDRFKNAYSELMKTIRQTERASSKYGYIADLDPTMYGNQAEQIRQAQRALESFKNIDPKNTSVTQIEELQKNLSLLEQTARRITDNGTIASLKGQFNFSNLNTRKNVLSNLAKQYIQGTVLESKWSKNNTVLTQTVRTADNMLQKYNITLKENGDVTKTLVSETKYIGAFGEAVNGLKRKFAELSRYMMASFSFYRIISMFRSGINVVKELDTAMTEMRKVSNDTEEALERFARSSHDIAQSIGSTAATIQQSAADWMRLGYSINEAAELSKNTAILMNVSEFDSIDAATESMVAMVQAFKDANGNVGELSADIIDKLNNIGNNYSISTSELAESLKRSSGTLIEANNDINEAIALTTAGNAIIQDAESTGSALKVISMRIRGTSAKELEEIGEDAEGLVETTSKLESKIKSLTSINGKGGISILNEQGNYRSTYEILQDIADIWETINEEDQKTGQNRQAALLELLAGKTRAQSLASILQNAEMLRDVYEDVQESEGSAEKENEEYLRSIAAHTEIVKAKWQEVWDSSTNRETVVFFVDLAGKVLDLVNDFGVLNSAVVAFGGYFGSLVGKNFTMDSITKATTGFQNILTSIKNAFTKDTTETVTNTEVIEENAAAREVLNNTAIKQSVAENYVETEIREEVMSDFALLDANQRLTQERLLALSVATDEQIAKELGIITTEGEITAVERETIAQNKNRISRIRDTAALTQQKLAAQGTTGAMVALKIAMGAIIGVIASFAITGVLKAIDEAIHKTERLKEAAEESLKSISDINDELKSNTKTVKEAGQRYAELAQQVENLGTQWQSQGGLSTEEYEEFLNVSNDLAKVFPQLTKGYTDNNDAILNLDGSVNTITSSLEHLLDVQTQLADKEILENSDTILENYNAQVSDIINGTGKIYGKKGIAQKENAKVLQGQVLNEILDGIPLEVERISEEEYKVLRDTLKNVFNVATSDIITTDANGTGFYDFSKLEISEEDKTALYNYTSKIIDECNNDIKLLEEQINKEGESVREFLRVSLFNSSDYKALTDDEQKVIEELFSNFDISSFIDKNKVSVGNNTQELANLFHKEILYSFKNIDNSDIKEQMINIMTGNIQPEDINQAYEEIVSYLSETLGQENEIYKQWAKRQEDRVAETNEILEHIMPHHSDSEFSAYQQGILKQISDSYEDGGEFYNKTVKRFKEENKVLLDFYNENAEKYRDNIEKLDDATRKKLLDESFMHDYAYSWEEILQKITDVAVAIEELRSPSQAVKQVNDDLKSQFDALKSAYQSIFSEGYDTKKQVGKGMDLSVVDTDMLESIRAAFEEIKEDAGVALDSKIVDEFITTLTDSASTAEDVQNAFNSLASSYFYSADGLKNLNEETAASIKQMLTQLGMVNADEFVDAGLAYKDLQDSTLTSTKALFNSIRDLAEAENADKDAARSRYSSIQESIRATLDEAGAADYTRLVLLELAYAEQQEALSKLDTSDKVDAITKLANAYLSAGEAAIFCKEMENAVEAASMDPQAAARLEDMLSSPEKLFADLKEKFDGGIHVGWEPSSNAAGSAGKSDAEKYKEAFDKEMETLDWLRENKFINDKEYWDQYRKLYEKFYKDNDKYAKEFYEHQQKYLQGIKELYEQAGSAAEDILDEEIDKYNELRDAEIEALEEQKKAIEERIKGIEDEIDAKQKLIDEENEEIQKMQDANDERKAAIDLQKSQYELDRLMHQRTNLVFDNDRGFHYVADTSGIRDAQEDVNDKKFDIEIRKREKKIKLMEDEVDKLNDQIDLLNDQSDAIDDQIDKTNEYYDNLIKRIEEYKKKWEELLKIEEKAQKRSYLQQLGYSVDDIINMDEATFDSFKTNYLGVLGSMYQDEESMLGALKDVVGDDLGDYLVATQDLIDNLNSLDLSSVNAGINSSYDTLLSFNDGLEVTQRLLDTIAQTIPKSLGIYPDETDKSSGGGSGSSSGKKDKSDPLKDDKQEDDISLEIKKVEETTKEVKKELKIVSFNKRDALQYAAIRDKQAKEELDRINLLFDNLWFVANASNEYSEQAIKDLEELGVVFEKEAETDNKILMDAFQKRRESLAFAAKYDKNAQDELTKLLGTYDGLMSIANTPSQYSDQAIEELKRLGAVIDAKLEAEKTVYASLQNTKSNYDVSSRERLTQLGEGGNVNLNLRPIIDTKFLNEAGWEAGEGFATVFTSSYTNKSLEQLDSLKYAAQFSSEAAKELDNFVAINFTPIIVDPETGEYKGVLTPEELDEYAFNVIDGVHDDYLNLQIGAEFNGADALEAAYEAASEIHDIHEDYLDTFKNVQKAQEDGKKKALEYAAANTQYAAEAQKELDEINGTAKDGADEITNATDEVVAGAERIFGAIDPLNTSLNNISDTTSNTLENVNSLGKTISDTIVESIQAIENENAVAETSVNSLSLATTGLINNFKDALKELDTSDNAKALIGAVVDKATGENFAEGTDGLTHNVHNALRSEYNQPELTVYPDGTYELTTTPTISNLPKGTVIYDEDQTKKILKGSGSGSAFASGTNERYLPLAGADLSKYSVFNTLDNSVNTLNSSIMNVSNVLQNMVTASLPSVTKTVTTNSSPTINMTNTFNCGGVTVDQMKDTLQNEFNGLAMKAYQSVMKK